MIECLPQMGLMLGHLGDLGHSSREGTGTGKKKQTLPVGFAVNDVPLESRIQLDFTPKNCFLARPPTSIDNWLITVLELVYIYIHTYEL